eukprot:gene9084-biopygen9471
MVYGTGIPLVCCIALAYYYYGVLHWRTTVMALHLGLPTDVCCAYCSEPYLSLGSASQKPPSESQKRDARRGSGDRPSVSIHCGNGNYLLE